MLQSIFKKDISVQLLAVYMFIIPFLKGMFSRHLFYLSFIILLILFVSSIKKNKFILIDKKIATLMAIQFVVLLTSMFTGINKEESFYGLMKGIFPMVLFFLLINLTCNKDESCFNASIFDKIFLAVFSSGTLISFLNYLVVSDVFNSAKAFVRFGAVIEYANTLAVFLFVCLSIGFYFSFKYTNDSLFKRVLIKTCIFFNASALILTYSRKMWVLSFFLFFVMILLYRNKRMLWDVLFIMSLSALFSAYISITRWNIGWILLILVTAAAVIALYEWGFQKVQKYAKKYLYKLLAAFILIGTAICILIFLKPEYIFTRISSISFNTSELQERFAYYRDSIKIIGNFPFTGTGYGGWASIQYQYQTSLYSTRFVHSSIIQAALDYGIAGLLIFVFQISLFFSYCYKAVKKAENKGIKALIISILLSNMAITLHSFLDVDFEFPIISALFWINIAFVSIISGNVTVLSGKKTSLQVRFLSFAAAILIFIQIFSLSSALCYNNGMNAFNAKDYFGADHNFNRALTFMPFSANAYYMRGKTAECNYAEKGDPKIKEICIEFYNQAQSMDKYNPRYIGGKVNIYKASMDYVNCQAELRKLIDVQPLVIGYYELFADTMIKKVEQEALKGNLSSQNESIMEVINLEAKIRASSKKFSQAEHTKELRKSFKLTPLLSLNIAKAYYLNKEYNMVEKYLPVAAQDKKLLNAVNELSRALQRVANK